MQRGPLQPLNSRPVAGPQAAVGRKTGVRVPASGATAQLDDWFHSDTEEDTVVVKPATVNAATAGPAAGLVRRWMPKIVSRRLVDAADEDDDEDTLDEHSGGVSADQADTSANMTADLSMASSADDAEGTPALVYDKSGLVEYSVHNDVHIGDQSGLLDYSLRGSNAEATIVDARRQSTRETSVQELTREDFADTDNAVDCDVDMSLETETTVSKTSTAPHFTAQNSPAIKEPKRKSTAPASMAAYDEPVPPPTRVLARTPVAKKSADLASDLLIPKSVLKSAKKSKSRRSSVPLAPSVLSDPEDNRETEQGYDVTEEAYMSEPETSAKGQIQATAAAKKRQRKNPNTITNLKIYTSGGLQNVTRDDGVAIKRSNRIKYKPLEYWRNERVVFGRRKSGPFPVPVIQEIIRHSEANDDVQRPVTAARKKQKLSAQKARQLILNNATVQLTAHDSAEIIQASVFAPEPADEDLKPIRDSAYLLCRSVRDPFGNTAASSYSGTIVLPRGASKPEKPSGAVTIFGNVSVGEVHVTIQHVTHCLTKGSSFVVPRGATYAFENRSSREARLFYVNVKQ